MRVLVACEYSGRVRDAFRAKGFDAWSCDPFEPCESDPQWHLSVDVLEILGDGWDLMVCHPPCTYLASSGLHWNKRIEGRAEKTEEALEFVRQLMDAPIQHIALENPMGCISTRIRKPDQTIQPWMFGDDASKATCLWLKNLPPLESTQIVKGRVVEHNGKQVERWANQTDSGQNKLPPSDDRWKERSRTYQGVANAMADQWGGFINLI
jgi:hypothetical protein